MLKYLQLVKPYKHFAGIKLKKNKYPFHIKICHECQVNQSLMSMILKSVSAIYCSEEIVNSASVCYGTVDTSPAIL